MSGIAAATAYTTATQSPADQREQVILDHLPQVKYIANHIYEHLPPIGVALEDLVSAGILGLIAAIDSFDPSRGVQIKTYAEYRIRGAILDSIRGLDGVPEHKRPKVKQIERSIQVLRNRLKHEPSEDEIAAELGISLEEYQNWLVELQGVRLDSLDACIGESDGQTFSDVLPDTERHSPSMELSRAELKKVIAEGLRLVPSQQRLVLNLYYIEEQNLREIAEILGLHVSRIGQLKTQGILRLRAYLDRCWPTGKGIY